MDDRPAVSLATLLEEADAVALVQIEAQTGDGAWLHVRPQAVAKGHLEPGNRYWMANPRLAGGALDTGDRLVVLLLPEAHGRFWPVEFGEIAAYRVHGGRVRAPDPGAADAANAQHVSFDVAHLLDAVRGCDCRTVEACTLLLEAARVSSGDE